MIKLGDKVILKKDNDCPKDYADLIYNPNSSLNIGAGPFSVIKIETIDNTTIISLAETFKCLDVRRFKRVNFNTKCPYCDLPEQVPGSHRPIPSEPETTWWRKIHKGHENFKEG